MIFVMTSACETSNLAYSPNFLQIKPNMKRNRVMNRGRSHLEFVFELVFCRPNSRPPTKSVFALWANFTQLRKIKLRICYEEIRRSRFTKRLRNGSFQKKTLAKVTKNHTKLRTIHC